MTIRVMRLFESPIVTFPEFGIARYLVIRHSKSTNVPRSDSKSYLITCGRINPAILLLRVPQIQRTHNCFRACSRYRTEMNSSSDLRLAFQSVSFHVPCPSQGWIEIKFWQQRQNMSGSK
jgi:hypothetical protein